MSKAARDGFEAQHLHLQEEEDLLERGADPDGDPSVGRSMLVGSLDRQGVSSPQEILEDVELLEELKSDQEFLADCSWGSDLGERQDFECAGATSPGNSADRHKHLEDNGSPNDQGLVSYWHPQRDQPLGVPEDDQDPSSSQDLEKQAGELDASSEGETYPELSYEVQYGSEYSTSPEALRDPLALYKSSKSYSFISEGGEEFSDNSNLSPSPSRLPVECTLLKTDAHELGETQEFPEEMALTSPSRRSPHGSSFGGSMGCSHSPLSVDNLLNSPSIEAETLPEYCCIENLGHPMGGVVKVIATAGRARTTVKPKEKLLKPNGAMETSHALRQVDYQQLEKAWKLKTDAPHGLPSKLRRQSRSLSPQGRATWKRAGESSLSKPVQASPVNLAVTDTLQYGRGQLNYPLPDLSKVEPRVKFPKNPQSYHPPRGRTPPARTKESGKPVVFKSPAEIVREVLLSSGEGSVQKCLAPTISVIPEELKSPRQATVLVHQLQEDYHKLLTKYAEAENTIDRLRLGAKVRLYYDLPKPSHGVQMGTVAQASKVMTFSIPQARTAEVTGSISSAPDAAWNEGFSGPQAASFPLPNSMGLGIPAADGFTSTETPFAGDHLTHLLASQASKFQTQVENLEELIRTRKLPLQDQLKGFTRLKEAQDALEQTYLQARDEYKQLQNHQEPVGALGDFDSDRAVEGQIFHLEMRLEELKERIDQAMWDQPVAQSSVEAPDSSPACFPAQASESQMRSPTPSLQAPVPAVCTPYPETPVPTNGHCQAQLDLEVDSISDETGEEGESSLPEPLRHMQAQVEKDFDHLLDHYNSFKSLPEALSLEQLHLNRHYSPPDEADGAAIRDVGTKEGSLWVVSKAGKTSCRPSTLQQPQQMEPPEQLLRKSQQEVPDQTSCSPSIQQEEEPVPQGSVEQKCPSTPVPKSSTSRRQQKHLSPQSSMVSVTGSAASEHTAKKSLQKTNTGLPENLRLVSPETDSGFVGSEASRVSPLAQMPKHCTPKLRSHSVLGKSTSVDVDFQAESLRKVPVTLETDRSPRHTQSDNRMQRQGLSKGRPFHLTSPTRWTNSITSEMEPGMDSAHTDSEAEAQAGLDTYNSPPDEARHSPSSSAVSLSPVQTHDYCLLDSRLHRDQAITALQNEVSHLRQILEKTLKQPHAYPKRPPSAHTSTLQRTGQDRTRLPTSANPIGSNRISTSSHSKTSGKSTADRDSPALLVKPEEWIKRSFLQDGIQLELSPSESDYSPPKPWKGKRQETSDSRKEPPKQPILRGPYTGTQYAFSSPKSQEPKTPKSSSPCPHCQEAKSQLEEVPTRNQDARGYKGCDFPRDSFGPSHQSTPKSEAPSHLCKDTRNSRSKVVHGVGHGTGNKEQSSGPQQNLSNHHQSQQPGLWYLALPSPAASISYVPMVPYPPTSVIYCSPLAPQISSPAAVPSRHQATELKTSGSRHQMKEDSCCSMTLDCAGLQDLNWSLSRAIVAARDMKLTTKRISRSLTSDLNKGRHLRGSCLF
ncbi:microtubule organization protein AKNA [Lacerta agilis]|uniref:microtubule organization protein AKNA n=1 Tax=Lacerta agilis TaxID=80427 RepID=UPI00141A0D53|nr:microtubule organization protein AKNA [Lacerta agilis]